MDRQNFGVGGGSQLDESNNIGARETAHTGFCVIADGDMYCAFIGSPRVGIGDFNKRHPPTLGTGGKSAWIV